MTGAREQILASIRRSLGPASSGDDAASRLAQPRRNLVPARATALDPAGRIELFARMAAEVHATVVRLERADEVPTAVAEYLARHNLPSDVVMAPDPALDDYPWELVPLLRVARGRAFESDAVCVTGAFAGIAETGSLMLLSGSETPSTLHLLPDTHVAVLPAERILATCEDGWERLRTRNGAEGMPRTVTFVTGPSRTGDIEQQMQLGAHGPRRLHILLVGSSAGGAV